MAMKTIYTTPQHMYRDLAIFFHEQGKPGMDSLRGGCVYLANDDARCAAGALITVTDDNKPAVRNLTGTVNNGEVWSYIAPKLQFNDARDYTRLAQQVHDHVAIAIRSAPLNDDSKNELFTRIVTELYRDIAELFADTSGRSQP